jgi:hypothetical protein
MTLYFSLHLRGPCGDPAGPQLAAATNREEHSMPSAGRTKLQQQTNDLSTAITLGSSVHEDHTTHAQ